MRLYRGQTLRWHMDLIARIYPGWDEPYAGDLVKRFELRPAQATGGCSPDQRVKHRLLRALARPPRLLPLDELTAGLYPRDQLEVLEALRKGKRNVWEKVVQ